MGVNVTQLLNEEIKVIVEGGDNIATKTELNAGLDLKANKVVGGVFNGMDLKAVAEKLNTDKQNVIADSGWQEISAMTGEVGTPMEGLPSFTSGTLYGRKIELGDIKYYRYKTRAIKLNDTIAKNIDAENQTSYIFKFPSGWNVSTMQRFTISAVFSDNNEILLTNMLGWVNVNYNGVTLRINDTAYINSVKGKYVSFDISFVE